MKSDIITGDCLEVMSNMPDDSVDLIVTSPPYADRRKEQYGGASPDMYTTWWRERAMQMFRILKPTGSLILNIKESSADGVRQTYVYEMVLDMTKHLWDSGSGSWQWIDEYVWRKTNSFPGTFRNRLRDGWERIYHFSPTARPAIYPDAVKRPAAKSSARRIEHLAGRDEQKIVPASGSKMVMSRGRWAESHRKKSKTKSGLDNVDREGWRDGLAEKNYMVLPDNVITGATVCHNVGHPAAFPEYIPEFFIKLLSKPGDVVLDPFVGSGTTYRVAHRLGRVAIGIDLSEEYTRKIMPEKTLFD